VPSWPRWRWLYLALVCFSEVMPFDMTQDHSARRQEGIVARKKNEIDTEQRDPGEPRPADAVTPNV
jgi:hypothetical protein